MPGLVTKIVARGAQRVPLLKGVPILRLLALAEVAVLARDHIQKLDPAEWRRMLELVRIGRGRPSNLSARQREELRSLVAKAEPRLFAGQAIDRFSPVHLPKRLVYGPKKPNA